MIEKITNILGSVRFWQLAMGLILLVMAYYEVIPQELANLIAGFLGISVGVGTLDKISQK